MEYESFWTRYFYRLHKLELKHHQFQQLAQRVQNSEEEVRQGSGRKREVGRAQGIVSVAAVLSRVLYCSLQLASCNHASRSCTSFAPLRWHRWGGARRRRWSSPQRAAVQLVAAGSHQRAKPLRLPQQAEALCWLPRSQEHLRQGTSAAATVQGQVRLCTICRPLMRSRVTQRRLKVCGFGHASLLAFAGPAWCVAVLACTSWV